MCSDLFQGRRDILVAKVFSSPARGSHPLLDLKCVILDRLRPDCSVLEVSSCLLWLERGTLRINRPLNLYSGHMEDQPRQPTCIMCNWQALHIPRGGWSESELLMLRTRLTMFTFPV